MSGYKYELHCHTSEGSRCSKISGKDLVRFYAKHGYAGVCITDHFTGSTTVPQDATWEDRIQLFREGYTEAKKEGDKLGLDVFFGLEYSDKGNDFLFFNVSDDWMLSRPEMRTTPLVPLLKDFRDSGGFVIHAHPFAQARWIEAIRLCPDAVDAVEVLNGGLPDMDNRRARAYAKSYGLVAVSGGDVHSDEVEKLHGIVLKKRVKTIEELTAAIARREARIFSKKI